MKKSGGHFHRLQVTVKVIIKERKEVYINELRGGGVGFFFFLNCSTLLSVELFRLLKIPRKQHDKKNDFSL